MVLLGKARMSMRDASPRNLEPSGLESGIFFSDPRDARERDFSFSLSLSNFAVFALFWWARPSRLNRMHSSTRGLNSIKVHVCEDFRLSREYFIFSVDS